MTPRQPQLQNKVFKDDKGVPYNGQRVIVVPTKDKNYFSGYIETWVTYNNGKLHGNPAIIYPDGLEEEWDNGKFVKISSPAYRDC
ncbi:MAG: hypothetical protein FWC97_09640 [Treponema sp.]|nr:hypothetical protein [Treponema sp.]